MRALLSIAARETSVRVMGRSIASLLLTAFLVGPAPGVDAAEGSATYPSKPIRWILPFPPGGPSDMLARLVGERLAERVKQPVIIDNRAGASGAIGMELAARAAPDGHTIVFGAPGSVTINPILYPGSFDALAELTAVSRLATFSFVLLANPQLPVRSIADLLESARAMPGSLTCGAGAALQQLACELLKMHGRVAISTIPYKGSAPAMTDLIGGQISIVFEVPNVAIGQVRGNRVRAIATTSPSASTEPFGGLPRVNETLPGFEVESWFGVLTPRGTSRQIVVWLDRELAAILAEEDVAKRLRESGIEPAHASPEVFSQIMHRDRARYSKLVREAGIKGEGQ